MTDEARRALGRLDAEVREHPRDRSAVIVRCDEGDLRAVKSRLQGIGYSFQPRRELNGVEETRDRWHVFKEGGRRGPPRNSRDLTRAVQRGDFGLPGGRR